MFLLFRRMKQFCLGLYQKKAMRIPSVLLVLGSGQWKIGHMNAGSADRHIVPFLFIGIGMFHI